MQESTTLLEARSKCFGTSDHLSTDAELELRQLECRSQKSRADVRMLASHYDIQSSKGETMESSTSVTTRRRFEPWLSLSVGMVVVSVVGLLYAYLHH